MDFATARLKMVDHQIRTTDVTDRDILRAFLTVPREVFVPEERRALAYMDDDLALGSGRYLMEAGPLAKLLQLARIRPTDTALDVGCGTGYSAAVIGQLAAKVTALEESEQLAGQAREALAAVSATNVEVVSGPLVEGASDQGPYNVIVFEGSVDAVPPVFFSQLAERGRLLAVEGHGLSGMAKLYSKEDGLVSDRFGFNCALRPLPGFTVAKGFVF